MTGQRSLACHHFCLRRSGVAANVKGAAGSIATMEATMLIRCIRSLKAFVKKPLGKTWRELLLHALMALIVHLLIEIAKAAITG